MKLKIGIVVAVLVVGGFLLWQFGFPQKASPTVNFVLPPDWGQPQTFEQPENNFTFSYPQKFNVTESTIEGIEGGKRILVEAEGEKMGFEMTILPFDEPGPLTEARLRLDLPDMVMENIISDVARPKISFDSFDENIGETHEVWFVNNGFLYQARTYREFGNAMQAILQTWKFK